MIERNDYIKQLVSKSWNGKVKIITGLRRSENTLRFKNK